MALACNTVDSHRRLSRDCEVHGITDPGPPVTSGSVGGSACAASTCSPAWVSLPVAQDNPAQPTPTRAPSARVLPTVRWSFAVPPNTRAAPRAAPLADVVVAPNLIKNLGVDSPGRGRTAAATAIPDNAATPSTAIPLTTRALVDRVAPGNRSAIDRRNECDTVPQPNAVTAATPEMIAWSRLARDSRLG